MRKTKVLFLCTGNSARSQMAEAFLRRYAGEQFEVYSAGLEPKNINPYTVRVMEEVGLSLEGQYSKSLTEYMGKVHFGYTITVCADAEEKCPSVFPGMGRRLHWGFEDPATFVGSEEETLAKFREIRDQIDERIKSCLTRSTAARQPAGGFHGSGCPGPDSHRQRLAGARRTSSLPQRSAAVLRSGAAPCYAFSLYSLKP